MSKEVFKYHKDRSFHVIYFSIFILSNCQFQAHKHNRFRDYIIIGCVGLAYVIRIMRLERFLKVKDAHSHNQQNNWNV